MPHLLHPLPQLPKRGIQNCSGSLLLHISSTRTGASVKKNNNSCIVHKGSHGNHVKIHSLHSKSRQTRFSISHFYSHIYSEITWWGIFINIKSNLAANMLISLSIRKTKHGNNANQKCMLSTRNGNLFAAKISNWLITIPSKRLKLNTTHK